MVSPWCLTSLGNWTLMVGEGGGWAKHTKNMMAIVCHFMVVFALIVVVA